MTETIDKKLELEDLPQPPEGACFDLQKIKKVQLPHPYCITPRHVGVASDDFGGMLGEDAIRAAEKEGAYCDICVELSSSHGDKVLRYDEHESRLSLYIRVPNNRANLNDIPGLHEYLFKNKAAFEAAGINGFAFANK
jgi:hypothetical protein